MNAVEGYRHVEDGCWCGDEKRREATLTLLYPDRCQEPCGLWGHERHCTRPAGHTEPHRGMCERIGSPCHYCGVPTPDDGEGMCQACWEPITDENAQATVDELSFAVEVHRLNREEGYTT